MKKKILVTGGAGYIGSHTLIELLKAGYDVVSIDNFCHSSPDTFKRIKKITGVSIKNYDVDLCNEKKTAAIFKKEKNISGIIHFAALKSVGESVQKPQLYYRNNIGSLQSILHMAELFKIPSFVFSSSCSVYGNVTKLPVHEQTRFGKPESPYAATKQLGEEIVKNFSSSQKITKSLSLRYFNPVGAHVSGLLGEVALGPSDNLLPILTETAMNPTKSFTIFGGNYKTRDGTCVRDYVHVSDIARAHVLALAYLSKKNAPSYDVINLGTGTGVTVLEMVKTFIKICKVSLQYSIGHKRPGDVVAVYSDTKKAKKVLGWKPKYKLRAMILSAWKWQKQLSKKHGKNTLQTKKRV